MSKRDSRPAAGRRYRSRLTRRLLLEFLLALAGYAAAVVVLLLLCRLLCNSVVWQPFDAFYQFLQWVKDNIILCAGAVILAGWIVISYLFLNRPLRYLDELVEAAEQLARQPEITVALPPVMQNMEDELNRVREQALRSAQEAREAEQRKNDLIVYLAHDLKTPLTSVIGYLTLLRDEPQLSAELRARYTGIALDKAERLEELLNEFFDITRFNLSQLTIERETVDLTRMLEQVVSEFGPVLAEKGLRCRLALPPKLEYPCDPDKLARVFDNLLRNACNYSFPDSTVLIAGGLEDERVVLSFTNAGKTIPLEKLSHIFEQFFRLDSARATRTGGAGLGLAIAREIIQLHGGTIRAESADSQITFTIELPFPQPAP